jgi:hypothetical protein
MVKEKWPIAVDTRAQPLVSFSRSNATPNVDSSLARAPVRLVVVSLHDRRGTRLGLKQPPREPGFSEASSA